jgi:hypothetical protein
MLFNKMQSSINSVICLSSEQIARAEIWQSQTRGPLVADDAEESARN